MADLVQEKCSGVTSDSLPVSPEEATELKVELGDWSLIFEDGMRKLRAEFHFSSFLHVLDFINRVNWMAEVEKHYPLTIIDKRKVTITWWTQKIHDLHRNDFIMAAKTDKAYKVMDWVYHAG